MATRRRLDRDTAIAVAYLAEQLHRVRRLPRLESLLSTAAPQRPQTAEEMMAALPGFTVPPPSASAEGSADDP